MEYLLLLFFLAYLAPWVLAEGIGHRHANLILALTLGLGWTGVGWAVAMGWVVRDWPHEPTPPKLVLLRPGMVLVDPARGRAKAFAMGLAALALLALIALAVLATAEPPTLEWRSAEVVLDSASVRGGPGEAWPVVGALGVGCPVSVLAREGAWRHVWRLEGCGETRSARGGWVRVESLRGRDESG